MRLQQYEYRQAGSSALQARAFLYLSGVDRKANTTRSILVVVVRCRQCEDGLFVIWKY